jgi:hypothetical protein
MAIFIPGGIVGGGTISGKSGGIVFSHNRFGAYIRNRSIPVNTNTSFQQAVRSTFGSLSARWVDTLTAAQRAGWADYADAVTVTSKKTGLPIKLTALNWYQKCNAFRALATGLAAAEQRIDDAPTVFALATFTPVTMTAEAEAGLDLVADDTDAWANEDGGGMLVFASKQKNPSINFFNGPFLLGGQELGDGTTPPGGAINTVDTNYAAGNVAFARVNVFRADGRIGSSQILKATIQVI